MSPHDHPFFTRYFAGVPVYHIAAEDRLRIIRACNNPAVLERLLSPAGVRLLPLQKTVQRAAESRLRRLSRQSCPPSP